jgi:beta-lactamase class A
MRRTPPAPTLSTYSYYHSFKTRQNSKRRLPNIVLAIPGIILLLGVGVYGGWNKHVAAQAAAKRQAEHALQVAAQQKSARFAADLQSVFAANSAVTVGVSIAASNLGIQNYGATSTFDAASTAKLLTAVSFLRLVEQHKISLSSPIEGTPANQLLEAMIVKSDDAAWSELNGWVTHARLMSTARSLGITDYDVDSNALSAGDIALLLDKVVHTNLLSAGHRQLLLSEMARANFRDYIVPAVAYPNLVYHKVGIDEDNVHDAAIIKHGDEWLVLVIYTNGNGQYNWPARAEMMQQITTLAQATFL